MHLHRQNYCKNPDLLCDEPTGALDYNTLWRYCQLVEDINVGSSTIVIWLHIMSQSARWPIRSLIFMMVGSAYDEKNNNRLAAELIEW